MPLRSLILDNFWLKMLSLVLACGIWLSISDYKSSQVLFGPRLLTREVQCYVSIMVSPATPLTFRLEPSVVMVKVQGDAGVLGRLRPDSIQAYVRLPEGFNNGGSCTVDVTAPRDVAVKEIVPDRVSLLRTNLNN